MITTREEWRMQFPAGLTEPDLHHWRVADIEGGPFYVCVSVRHKDWKNQEHPIGGNFLFFSSPALIDFLDLKCWLVQRFDLFVIDSDKPPSFNNFRIESMYMGHSSDPMNSDSQAEVCRFETFDGEEFYFHGDMVCDEPPPIPFRRCYSAQFDR